MKMLHPLLYSFQKCVIVILMLAGASAFALTTPSTGAVAAGNLHTIVLKNNGTVWTWGFNGRGQLGDGTTTSRATPVQVSGLSGIVAVEGGVDHTVALKSDGTVWTWGSNSYGQLGDGTLTDRYTAVRVSGLANVVAIATGSYHTVALKSDGTVWTWGYNNSGQLGDGTVNLRTTAGLVYGLTGIVAVTGGNSITMALKSDGTVWSWGSNMYGKLGDGTFTNRSSPVQVVGLSGIVAVTSGSDHTVALKSDGTLWAWGYNNSGHLGDGTTTNRATPVQVSGLSGVVAVTAGSSGHNVALKSDGTVWAWGNNNSGQLGDDTMDLSTIPVQVSGLSGAGVIAAAAGSNHTVVLKSDGTVWAWGDNNYYQLGDGSISYRATAVQMSRLTDVKAMAAGDAHTIALKSDGTVWAWGDNNYRQLSQPFLTKQPIPTPVSGLSGVIAVAAGSAHNVALKSDHTVWTWGRDTQGQLGLGGTGGTSTWVQPVTQVGGLSGVNAVAAGTFHTVALKSDGTVSAWGYNAYGQLGNGTTAPWQTTPVTVSGLTNVVAIEAGSYHTVALKGDGTVWAWGWNFYGELGDGTTTQRTTAVQVSGLTNVIAIAAGGTIDYPYTLALKSNGTVWAWGYNGNGQLGDGTTTNQKTPVQVSGLTAVEAMAAGGAHVIARKFDGSLWTWGMNDSGQLGDGTITQRKLPVPLSSPSSVLKVAAGANHSLALKSDGTLSGWGRNSSGQLGYSSNRLTQAAIRLTASADDLDQDGMNDAWEIQYFGNLSHNGSTDTDGDGLTDIQEFARGSDPTQADTDGDGLTDFVDLYPNDYYNATTPSLTVFSGDNQTAAPNSFNSQPLDVAVWNAAATSPLVNAPVTFAVTSGEGNLAATLNGTLVSSLTVRADPDGTAPVYFKHGSSFGAISTITVTAGNAQLFMVSTTSKQSQTITFADPGSQIFGTPLPLNATASSGLPVSFSTSGPVTISGGVATFTGSGSVTITAKQSGDSIYSAAPDVVRTFNVNPGSQLTVSVSPSTASVSVGNAVTFTASGGSNSYVWGGSASGSGASQTITFNSVGTFNITVYAQAGGNYAQSNTATATVTARDTTPPVIAPQSDLTLEATSAAGATVTFTPSATDLVDGPVTVSASPLSGSTFALGTNTVTLTATDAAGNVATRTFTVTVRDTTAPVIIAPANQILEATSSDGAIATYGTSANDLVDGAIAVNYSRASGNTFALGANTVTVTATDTAGNTSTNTFTITVRDTTAPVITVPAIITTEATSAAGATVTLFGSATDLVSGNLSVSFNPASGTVFPLGETNVTATATDAAGNTATATLLVKVVDTVAPILTVPANQTIEATGPSGAIATYTALANDLVSGAVTVNYSTASGSTFGLGNTTVIVTAIDAVGNSSTRSFTVTVRDTTAPAITVPVNQTLEATGSTGAIATYNASANDLVDGIVAVSYNRDSGSTFALGANTVTVTATDATGNTATSNFTVTVVDTTAPVITAPATITAEATSAAGATVTLFGSATDLVDGSVAVSFNPASNTVFPLGETTVTVTATDATGNTATATVLIKVVDTVAPILTLPADMIVEATGSTGAAVTFAAHATDTVNGDLSVNYSVEPGSVFALGTTTVTVTAVDAAGNIVTGNFTITVADHAAPVITAPANQTLEATGPSGAIATYSASANDLVDGPVAVSVSPASGSTFALGTNSVTLTATDAAGNRATRTFTVTVRDTTAPRLNIPANIALAATDQSGTIVTYNTAATDLVDGSVAVVTSMPSGSSFPLNATQVTLTATDAAGNTTTGSFTVTLSTISPFITNHPQSQVVAVGSSVSFSVEAVGTRPFSYKWKRGSTTIAGATGSILTIPSAQASDAGSYSVVVSNPAAPTTSATATLSVQTPPTITTQPTNQTVTAGKNAIFKVVASGTATLNYQWYFNGSAIAGATAATYTVTAAQPANVGIYSATVTNAVGSVSSGTATLTVNNPVVIASQPASQSVTLGTSVTFSVDASGTGPLSYQWRLGGVALAGATSSSYTIPAAQTSDAGNYSVVVTNVVGSVTSSTAILKVNTPPAITTQPISKTVTSGTSVTLKVVATGTATLTYQWQKNGVPISGATAATYIVIVNSTTIGSYTVVVANIAGNVTSSAAVLSLP